MFLSEYLNDPNSFILPSEKSNILSLVPYAFSLYPASFPLFPPIIITFLPSIVMDYDESNLLPLTIILVNVGV